MVRRSRKVRSGRDEHGCVPALARYHEQVVANLLDGADRFELVGALSPRHARRNRQPDDACHEHLTSQTIPPGKKTRSTNQ
jgi:hypothetical protein